MYLSNGSRKRYFTDLIGEKYKSWKDTKVILDGGTGSGKTYFVQNVLIPYVKLEKKKVLYLCNRRPLYDELLTEMKKHTNVDLMLYQVLQEHLRNSDPIGHYEFIIADECHYLYTDALFNEYTDLSYNFLLEQKNNVVIFMSATAPTFFRDLQQFKIVDKKNVFTVPKDYSYVKNVYFYDGNDLVNVIDDIIQKHPNDKIIIFVNSMDRLKEIHDIYEDISYFMCSKSTKRKDILEFCTNDCIVQYEQDYITFDRKILVATKALDNGINIKDPAIKHIFCEIFDIDSAIQAIGRKRCIGENDTCNFYFKNYGKKAIARFLNINEQQYEPVKKYLQNKNNFLQELKENNVDIREFARENRIMYTDWDDKEQIQINNVRYKKYRMDNNIIRRMRVTTYQAVLNQYLGAELVSKIKELEIITVAKDLFLEYLISVVGKKLFQEEQKVLKSKMRNFLGLNDRTMGIGVCNGKLSDCQYPYTIVSKQENSRQSSNYKKRYWMIISSKDANTEKNRSP